MAYRSEDLLRLVQGAHTDAVRALEERTVNLSVGDLDRHFDTLVRATLVAWTKAFGAPTAPGVAGPVLDGLVATVRSAVHRALDQLGPQARGALRDALPHALRLGAVQGVAFLRAASGRGRTIPSLRVPQGLATAAARVADVIADRRARALTLLGRAHVNHWSDLIHAIGAARSAGAAVRAHTAWTLGQAVNAGLDAVSTAAGTARVWVAEADACVRCLAYAGVVTQSGRQFSGGLSWDPRSRIIGAAGIDGPPLHAHCRCRTVPWSSRWHATEGVPFPLALQREAHRSLAYGRARPSESRATRLRATRELLRTEPDLLTAVEATARTAVAAGRFPVAA